MIVKDALCAQWKNADTAFIDGDAVLFNDIDTNLTNYVINPSDRLLSNYRNGMALAYSSASALTVSAGEVMVSNSAGTIRLMMNNTSSASVSFSDLDTGSEASSTTYYVYAVAATTASETATFKISASGTAPSGVTYYKKLGSFYNDSSSNIDQNKIYAAAYDAPFTDASGIDLGRFLAIYDYGTSASSSTRRNPSTYFIAHGTLTLSGSDTISNLPFTSSSTYSVTATRHGGSYASQGIVVSKGSGSQFTILDFTTGSQASWIAIGY